MLGEENGRRIIERNDVGRVRASAEAKILRCRYFCAICRGERFKKLGYFSLFSFSFLFRRV